MRIVSVAEAKSRLSDLLNTVEAGEEVVITRHGKAVARVVAEEAPRQSLPLKRLAALRASLPAWSVSSAEVLRRLRDAE